MGAKIGLNGVGRLFGRSRDMKEKKQDTLIKETNDHLALLLEKDAHPSPTIRKALVPTIAQYTISMMLALQRHNTENSKQIFQEKELPRKCL
jgi:hypothetical protein